MEIKVKLVRKGTTSIFLGEMYLIIGVATEPKTLHRECKGAIIRGTLHKVEEVCRIFTYKAAKSNMREHR